MLLCSIYLGLHVLPNYEFQGLLRSKITTDMYSPVENQNDLELDFNVVFFFVDYCYSGIVLDESS